MSHSIIDRRKNDSGKSSVNRRKFINRVRGLIRDGVKDVVRDANIKDLVGSSGKKIKIPIRNLDEPHFHHDGTGINDIVRPGNDQFVPGDKIARPKAGGGKGDKASADGEGEDEFTFHLTKEEFLDIFFENCALPDLIKQNLALLNEEVMQRSGFTSDGAPSQLNVMRSMRQAKSRRFGLRTMKTKKLKELEELERLLLEDLKVAVSGTEEHRLVLVQLEQIKHNIETIKRKIKAIPFVDPVDLKFNSWNKVQIPSVQAVMLCVMDVSGSMDERKKELAKTFYVLLYLFLQKNYEHIDITFIQYHSHASVVDEQEFYYGHQSGGTVTSTGLQLAYDTIMKNYPLDLWNIYIAHASDGDNYPHDNDVVYDLLEQKILPLVQYYAYVQIITEEHRLVSDADDDSLWGVFYELAQASNNLSTATITDEESVYPVFKKLFERKA